MKFPKKFHDKLGYKLIKIFLTILRSLDIAGIY